MIDFVGSLAALVLFFPLLLVAGIALYIESGTPIFYTDRRVGKDRKIFGLYKLRTMIPDADKFLWENNPELLEEYKRNGYKLSLKNDPRITKVGRFLRRFDIDEMPQFINVLLGDMSLVGPRAYKPHELEEQQKNHPWSEVYISESLTVKPGITGLWQTSGRNRLGYETRIKMDAQYAKEWNVLKDLWLLIKTPIAVLKSHGD
jgi:undecaprenyl-phosphate galactose phosphotransferase